jgi:hypothetical protein
MAAPSILRLALRMVNYASDRNATALAFHLP